MTIGQTLTIVVTIFVIPLLMHGVKSLWLWLFLPKSEPSDPAQSEQGPASEPKSPTRWR